MTSKQTYSVNDIKQLIDLNGDSTNFECNFKIISQNKEPFFMVVVDQTTLDTTPELEYQYADKGEISGTLSQNENVYQNFFIVLRSDKPCMCEVEIDKKVLPMKIIPKPIQEIKSIDYKNFFYIGIAIIAICVVLYFGYNYFKKKNNSKSSSVFKFPENSDNNNLLDRLKNLDV